MGTIAGAAMPAASVAPSPSFRRAAHPLPLPHRCYVACGADATRLLGCGLSVSCEEGEAEPPLQELAPAATSGLWTRSVHDRPRVSESALSGGTSPVWPWPWTGARCLAPFVPGAGSVWLPGLCVVDRWVGHDCFTCGCCCLRPHTITPLPWRERGIQFPQHKNKHTSQARGDEVRKAQGGGERNLHLVFRGRWTIARGPSHTPFGGVRSLASTYRRCGANWAPPYNLYSHKTHHSPRPHHPRKRTHPPIRHPLPHVWAQKGELPTHGGMQRDPQTIYAH
eukprot:scaffold5260_cov141-Isochrysis_galbana.AAC.2